MGVSEIVSPLRVMHFGADTCLHTYKICTRNEWEVFAVCNLLVYRCFLIYRHKRRWQTLKIYSRKLIMNFTKNCLGSMNPEWILSPVILESCLTQRLRFTLTLARFVFVYCYVGSCGGLCWVNMSCVEEGRHDWLFQWIVEIIIGI